MRNVCQQPCADFIRNLAEFLPVRNPRVRCVACHDDLGLAGFCLFQDLVVIQAFGFGVNGIVEGVIKQTGAIDWRTMGQMTTHQEVHTQDRIARLDQGGINSRVGRSAGERLHVYPEVIRVEIVGREEFRGTPASQGFQHIYVLNAFVVAWVAVTAISSELIGVIHEGVFVLVACFRAGITFGIDIGEW